MSRQRWTTLPSTARRSSATSPRTTWRIGVPMPSPALYLDECINRGVEPGLRSRNLSITSAHAAGMLGASDMQQLAFAAQHNLVLVSHKLRDVYRLHHQSLSHAGILILPENAAPDTAQRVARLTVRIAMLTNMDRRN